MPKNPVNDLTGKRFGKLLVLSKLSYNGYWLCKCDCGKTVEMFGRQIKSLKSCGCTNNSAENSDNENKFRQKREEILKDFLTGYSLGIIAEKHNCTRQNVHQMLKSEIQNIVEDNITLKQSLSSLPENLSESTQAYIQKLEGELSKLRTKTERKYKLIDEIKELKKIISILSIVLSQTIQLNSHKQEKTFKIDDWNSTIKAEINDNDSEVNDSEIDDWEIDEDFPDYFDEDRHILYDVYDF